MSDSTSRGIIKYTSRDYDSIMQDFWSIVPTLTELWKPEAEADPGVVLGKFLASAADLINRHYLVYAHILPDKSAYVGMTGTSVQDRSGKDGTMYINHQSGLYQAAQQFGGWNNIEHYTLLQGLTYEQAVRCEELFTELFEAAGYKMFNKRYGYKGYKHTAEARAKIAQSSASRSPSPETRQKISAANSGKVRTAEQVQAARRRMKAYYTPERRKAHSQLCKEGNRLRQCGTHLSSETKNKISEKLCGRAMSDDWKSKISQSLQGNIPSNAKRVIAVVDGQEIEFESCAECSRHFGKHSDWASSYCRTNKITPEGIQLRYKEVV